jgi:membrane-bound lytic murein transglycosylase D
MSLNEIAEQENLSIADLKMWNKLKGSTVAKGKRLIIYKNTIRKEESEISENQQKVNKTQRNTVVEENEINDSTQLKTTNLEEKSSQKMNFLLHTVQKGDTLWNIANRYKGATVDDLIRINKLAHNKSLKIGSKIKVPLS